MIWNEGGVRRQRGMSLVEVLVTLPVLLFGISAALIIYNGAWETFKNGENATEQQQTVRIAVDKIGLDLQMAGFNFNPDGDETRPDEQIEAAFDTAIVLRADFDAHDPSAATSPEGALAGGAFEAVSTGNDEIVAYVLAKADGSSTGTLTFQADVGEAPRDGAVETINIPNVALVQDDPPYTLFRITLDNDPNKYGTSAFPVREVLAENIMTLTFRYFGSDGVWLNDTFDLTGTSDDVGGSDTATARLTRAAIYRIRFDLVGMTRDPDLNWQDPHDSAAGTTAYRKFRLEGEITPRNVGMVGIEDLAP